MAGILYVVATPIGNLQDVTQRALEVLGRVPLVACEDTRHTRKLLRRYGLDTRTVSFHEHNEQARLPRLLSHLEAGRDLALVCDAGTPGISDPGFRLVRAVREKGWRAEAVPGPSAAVAALSVSGLPTDAFTFLGFLPSRRAARRRALREVGREPRTLVFYEAPHRLAAALGDMVEVLGGERPCFLAREMTKLHEEHFYGTLAEVRDELSGRDGLRGEATVVVGGAALEQTGTGTSPASLAEEVDRLRRASKLGRMEAIKRVARERGLPKSVVYDAVLRAGREES